MIWQPTWTSVRFKTAWYLLHLWSKDEEAAAGWVLFAALRRVGIDTASAIALSREAQ